MSQSTLSRQESSWTAVRGIMAAVAIAFVWALLFTIGVMTGLVRAVVAMDTPSRALGRREPPRRWVSAVLIWVE